MALDLTGIISIIAAPIGGAVGYLAGSKKRNNDFLTDLQSSIDLLSKKNTELLTEIVKVKQQNAELQVALARIQIENEALSEQVEALRNQLKSVIKLKNKNNV